jgi:hypothetical protein
MDADSLRNVVYQLHINIAEDLAVYGHVKDATFLRRSYQDNYPVFYCIPTFRMNFMLPSSV